MHSMKDRLQLISRGGDVKRFHTRPVIHSQTNAEHQYMVASIAILLNPYLSFNDLKNILWHDILEAETGDIPWLVKRNKPEIKQLLGEMENNLREKYGIPEETKALAYIVLKLSEYFEVMYFCLKEKKLGNSEFDKSIIDCVNCISELLDKLIRSDRLGKQETVVHRNALELLSELKLEALKLGIVT